MSYVNVYITAEDLTSDFFRELPPFEDCDGVYIVLDYKGAYVNEVAVEFSIKSGQVDRVLIPQHPKTAERLIRSLWFDQVRHPNTGPLVDDTSELTGNEHYEWWIYSESGQAVRVSD